MQAPVAYPEQHCVQDVAEEEIGGGHSREFTDAQPDFAPRGDERRRVEAVAFPRLRVRHPLRAGRSFPVSGRKRRRMNADATSIQPWAGQSVHSAAVMAAGSAVGRCSVPKSIIYAKVVIF